MYRPRYRLQAYVGRFDLTAVHMACDLSYAVKRKFLLLHLRVRIWKTFIGSDK